MSTIRPLLTGLGAYSRAGRFGRRYLRDLRRQSNRNGSGSASDYMRDQRQWKLLMRNFSRCDGCFSAWVPRGITSATGSDRLRIYRRLVPFAWVSQAIRVRMFAAFGLECDRAAEERSILQSFTHREWNDLADQWGISHADLYDIFNPDKPLRSEMKLYQSFSRRLIRSVPAESFPNYYRLVQASPRAVSPHTSREAARKVTSENALFSVRISFYIMRDQLPDAFLQVLPAFGFWLYCLDEFADLERDARVGKNTYMSTVTDPEKELENVFRQMAAALEEAAPRPCVLLDYLELLQSDVVRLKRRGVDIEKRLLHAD